MLESLLGEIVELLFVAAGCAILKFLGFKNPGQIAIPLVGLGFIAIGVAVVWLTC
jgi:hypothetical protein